MGLWVWEGQGGASMGWATVRALAARCRDLTCLRNSKDDEAPSQVEVEGEDREVIMWGFVGHGKTF